MSACCFTYHTSPFWVLFIYHIKVLVVQTHQSKWRWENTIPKTHGTISLSEHAVVWLYGWCLIRLLWLHSRNMSYNRVKMSNEWNLVSLKPVSCSLACDRPTVTMTIKTVAQYWTPGVIFINIQQCKTSEHQHQLLPNLRNRIETLMPDCVVCKSFWAQRTVSVCRISKAQRGRS